MKYYDYKGQEISKYRFYKRVKDIKQHTPDAIICTTGKTGTGESYKQLWH